MKIEQFYVLLGGGSFLLLLLLFCFWLAFSNFTRKYKSQYWFDIQLGCGSKFNWEFGWARAEKVWGNKRHKFPVIKLISHRDVMHSIKNVVNNIVINVYSVT